MVFGPIMKENFHYSLKVIDECGLGWRNLLEDGKLFYRKNSKLVAGEMIELTFDILKGGDFHKE